MPKAAAKPAPKAKQAQKVTARYELLERVATGGMAQLYKARVVGPEGFDKLVAVKRILDVFSSNEEFVRMFIDEARLAALLNHPNVVQVFELGRDSDHNLFISMELVPGVELGSMLERLRAKRRRMPEAAALEVMVQVLRGLHHAHTKLDIRGRPLHLVHRDVSPQNILVTTEGVAKLLDFGVAKANNRLTETQAGLIKGKLLYMSPEQSRNRAIDARTDQFAAALVLWECLVGEPCYTFPSDQQTMRAVALGQVRTFEEVGIPVDPELESAIMAALAAKPEDRYENCEDFANALLRYKQRNYPSYTPTMLGKLVADTCPKEMDVLTRAPDLEGPNVVPLHVAQLDVSTIDAGAAKHGKLMLIAGGALAVVGLAAGGVALWVHDHQPPPEEQIVVVEKPKTVKVIEYRERPPVPGLPTSLDAGVTVTDADLPDGGTGKHALLPDGRSGWIFGLGDGSSVLAVDLEDGGRILGPFTLPGEPPPPAELPINSVDLDDGGHGQRADLPDGGAAWAVPLEDGGGALAVDLPDGGRDLFGVVQIEIPAPPEPDVTFDDVDLDDGGKIQRAHLPDGGAGLVWGPDGGMLIAPDLEDGGSMPAVPFGKVDAKPDGG